MMDYLMYVLFDYCENPLELAVRFLFVILLMDGIFGIVSTVLGVLRGK